MGRLASVRDASGLLVLLAGVACAALDGDPGLGTTAALAVPDVAEFGRVAAKQTRALRQSEEGAAVGKAPRHPGSNANDKPFPLLTWRDDASPRRQAPCRDQCRRQEEALPRSRRKKCLASAGKT